jgi:hypothetical protein
MAILSRRALECHNAGFVSRLANARQNAQLPPMASGVAPKSASSLSASAYISSGVPQMPSACTCAKEVKIESAWRVVSTCVPLHNPNTQLHCFPTPVLMLKGIQAWALHNTPWTRDGAPCMRDGHLKAPGTINTPTCTSLPARRKPSARPTALLAVHAACSHSSKRLSKLNAGRQVAMTANR